MYDVESYMKNMSIAALKSLLESNPEALAKVKSAANHAEVSEIAKGYGVAVSAAEVMKHAATQTAELDDEALEAVAGGAWGNDSGQDTANTTGAAGAAGGIAATVGVALLVK